MNTKIKITSPIASPIRRAPGVIAVFARPAIEASAAEEVRDFESTALLGVNARYQFETLEGFSIEAAGTNLFNKERSYLLPYKGENSTLGHMPGPSREWMIGADYVVSF